MKSGKLLYQKYQDVGILTYNRPERLNSLNLDIIHDLINYHQQWEQNNQYPRILITRGAGEKSYCSGGDLKESYERYQATISDPSQRRFNISRRYIAPYILKHTKPVHVAFLNGITMGQGAGVSMMAPIKIATEKTNFAMPEARIGLFNDAGSTYFMTHLLPPEVGLYLGLTASSLKGKEVYDWGMATHYLQTQKYHSLKEKLVSKQPQQYSDVMDLLADSQPERSDEVESKFVILKSLFQLDSLEAIVQRLKEAQSRGSKIAEEALIAMRSLNPLSLKIILESYKRGMNVSYEDAFQMECLIFYNLHINGVSNFIEGVRALLIDKDKNPRWKPASITEVKDTEVTALFEDNKDVEFKLDFRDY